MQESGRPPSIQHGYHLDNRDRARCGYNRASSLTGSEQTIRIYSHSAARHCGSLPCDVYRPDYRLVPRRSGGWIYWRNSGGDQLFSLFGIGSLPRELCQIPVPVLGDNLSRA